MSGEKRDAPESALTFGHIYGVYRVISKNPGNDYSKVEFWKKASTQNVLPEKLRDMTLEDIAALWPFIQQRTRHNLQLFKSLFRDYERTAVDDNTYHTQIKAKIHDMFFGAKASSEAEQPEKRREAKAATKQRKKRGAVRKSRDLKDSMILPPPPPAPVEDLSVKREAEEEKRPESTPHPETPQREAILIKPESEKTAESPGVTKVEPVPPTPAAKDPARECKDEDILVSPNDLLAETIIENQPHKLVVDWSTPLRLVDRELKFDIQSLYQVCSSPAMTRGLDLHEKKEVPDLPLSEMTDEQRHFVKMFTLLAEECIPDELLNINIKTGTASKPAPEEKKKVAVVKVTEKKVVEKKVVAEKVVPVLTAEALAKLEYRPAVECFKEPELEPPCVWTEKEDATLKMPSDSAEYLALVKEKSEIEVRKREELLESRKMLEQSKSNTLIVK